MNTSAFIIVIVGLLIFAALAVVLLLSNRSAQAPASRETWRAFAQQSGGSYSENPLGRARKVTLAERGWPLSLEAWSTLDGPGDSIQSYTRLLAQGAFAPLAAYVLHAESRLPGAPAINLTQRGGEAFATGDRELDAGYTFRSSDPARASALLRTPVVRDLLLRLNAPEAYLDIAVEGGAGVVRFGGEDTPLSVARLDDTRRLVVAVLDGLAAGGAARTP